jgi:hypothetical protein
MAMKVNLAEFTEQFGFILFVEKFYECEKFYAELAGATKYLKSQGVDLVTHHFDWGSIAAFADPDGNRCELKTSPMR